MDLRTIVGPLPDEDREAVLALVAGATTADGVAPLDEAALLALGPSPHLRASETPGAPAPQLSDAAVIHLLASETSGALAPQLSDARVQDAAVPDAAARAVGYAQVDRGGDVPGAQLVVDPRARQQGVGRALLGAAQDAAGGRLEVWAHGDLPAARALAASAGFAPVHELWRMALDLEGRPRVDAPLPAGIVVRAFRPGDDEGAWLALNARAFVGHPDQGRWTADDLAAREREPWFDPSGFLLAERAAAADAGDDSTDGETSDGNGDGNRGLAGFVWTKVHPAGELAPGEVGELYVVGVDPRAQGLGLGRALTAAGLDSLAARGLATAVLWVAGDNEPAIRAYRRAGFQRVELDVRYAPGPTRSPAGAFMGS